MSALRRMAVEARLIAELRLIPSAAKPHTGEIRRAIAAELGSCSLAEFAAAVQSLRYRGKLHWERLELAASMISADGVASAVKAEGGAQPSSADGRVSAVPAHPSQPGPDDEEDDGVNDRARERPLPAPAPEKSTSAGNGGFVPKSLLHRAGVHAAQTRAAARPVAPPAHEPEIARLVREEVEEKRTRRRSALSTATVSQPLELRKYGVPDMTFSEAVGSMLSDDPKAIMRAVSRKHPAMWRRCIFLGRATGKSPMQALYAALESGLAQLEPQQEHANGA